MDDLNQSEQKQWLDTNAQQVLTDIGVAAGQVLVDFGCGSGTYSIPAARLVDKAGSVYALDKDAQALEDVRRKAAEQGLQNIKTMLPSEKGKIELSTFSCDIMLLYDVLHLIDDWTLLFDETYRMLKPGGLLSVYPMHIDRDKLKRFAQDAGFTSIGEIHTLLNFSKRGTD